MILILVKNNFTEFKNEILNENKEIKIKEYFTPISSERDIYEAVFILLSESSDDNEKMIASWTGTPHLRVCENIFELESEVLFFLGIPEPLEIERKFLIEYPDIKYLESLINCASVEISQIYIEPLNKERFRIRKRGSNGNYTYFHTIKRHISDIKRIEEERIIDKDEYEAFLKEENAAKLQINKTRYCLVYDNKYFEIDVFPFWNDKAYIEIELRSEDEKVVLPPFVKIIKEVTEDRSYTNLSLAKIYGNKL